CLAATPVRTARGGDALADLEERQEEIFDRIGPSVVFLSDGDRIGSGFFVAASGLILTSAHVVKGRTQVTVVDSLGRTWKGEVVERADKDIDLALVQIPRTDAPALRLASNHRLRVGAWLASVGHGRGGIWSYHIGMVTNIYPLAESRPV